MQAAPTVTIMYTVPSLAVIILNKQTGVTIMLLCVTLALCVRCEMQLPTDVQAMQKMYLCFTH